MYLYDYPLLVIDGRRDQEASMISLLKQHAPVYGIEMTARGLLPYLTGNLDPQHPEDPAKKSTIAACQAALTCDLPESGTTLVTNRDDADSVATAAIFGLRAAGEQFNDALLQRVAYLGREDSFTPGRAPWVKRADTGTSFTENDERYLFNGLSRLASEAGRSLNTRVRLFKQWLLTGTCEGLDIACKEALAELNKALTESIITLLASGRMVVVESEYYGATQVAYLYAPVILVFNPVCTFGLTPKQIANGESYGKYTIAAWAPGLLDCPTLTKVLNEDQPEGTGTWGGPANLVASPIKEDPQSAHDKIINATKAALL